MFMQHDKVSKIHEAKTDRAVGKNRKIHSYSQRLHYPLQHNKDELKVIMLSKKLDKKEYLLYNSINTKL